MASVSDSRYFSQEVEFTSQSERTTTPSNNEEKLIKTINIDKDVAVIGCFRSRFPMKETFHAKLRPALPPVLSKRTSRWALEPIVLQQSTEIPSGYWTDTASLQLSPEHPRKHKLQDFTTPSQSRLNVSIQLDSHT